MNWAGGFATLTAILVGGLLVAERAREPRLRAATKSLASASFLACAMAAGAWSTPYGAWVLIGLTLSWIGDVCLLSREKRPFVAGLLAFLLAHVAYGAAFLVAGVDASATGLALLLLAIPAFVTSRWLLPNVEERMKTPVVAYIVVITGMLALGVGAFFASGRALLLAAPALFYLSDLTVARDRFVQPGFANRLVGLPLYYAGQILFALSTMNP